MRKVFACVLAVAMVALSGCGLAEKATEKVMEKAVESATGVSVDEKNGTVTMRSQDGQEVTVKTEEAGGDLPEGFPLAVFPGAKVTTGSKLTVNGKVAYTVELAFQGDAKPVADFYEKALKEQGVGDDLFRADASQDEEDSATLSGTAAKGTAYIWIQSLKKTKEGTVSISWSEI